MRCMFACLQVSECPSSQFWHCGLLRPPCSDLAWHSLACLKMYLQRSFLLDFVALRQCCPFAQHCRFIPRGGVTVRHTRLGGGDGGKPDLQHPAPRDSRNFLPLVANYWQRNVSGVVLEVNILPPLLSTPLTLLACLLTGHAMSMLPLSMPCHLISPPLCKVFEPVWS